MGMVLIELWAWPQIFACALRAKLYGTPLHEILHLPLNINIIYARSLSNIVDYSVLCGGGDGGGGGGGGYSCWLIYSTPN